MCKIEVCQRAKKCVKKQKKKDKNSNKKGEKQKQIGPSTHYQEKCQLRHNQTSPERPNSEEAGYKKTKLRKTTSTFRCENTKTFQKQMKCGRDPGFRKKKTKFNQIVQHQKKREDKTKKLYTRNTDQSSKSLRKHKR